MGGAKGGGQRKGVPINRTLRGSSLGAPGRGEGAQVPDLWGMRAPVPPERELTEEVIEAVNSMDVRRRSRRPRWKKASEEALAV